MMDKEGSCRLQEVNNMQLKISSLFKDLLNEKNDYKLKSENLNKKLEQINDETQNLKNETETLKRQNEALKLINDDMSNVIERGIKIFQNLDFSKGNLGREDRMALETLKTLFIEFSTKLGNCKITHEVTPERIEKSRVWQNDAKIQLEIEGLDNLNLCTDFFGDEVDENSPKKDSVFKKSNSDAVLKTVVQNKYEGLKTPKEVKSENEAFDSEFVNRVINANAFRPSQTSPEILQNESHLNRSPVFKDFSVKKNESFSSEENSNSSFTSLSVKLLNEKFLERSNDFILSPWKKSPRQSKQQKSPSSPRRIKRQLKLDSPNRSPILKKSNSREAEISFSGIRKLRQTFLNIDCYKKKTSENRENENVGNRNNNGEDKTIIEDDDFIIESPKKVEQEDKNKKSGQNLNDVPFITPPQTSDADLDETYISSSLIRKCNMTKKHELERIIEEQTPLKRPAREKSPEYDSVPFVYKREAVRKKTERLKLPGHACPECNKYYENVFDEIGSQDLKKILNKCSRHRDKNSPTLDDTPPGYWKPFLTCSTVISPNKDDISINNC